jgi:hypothetical protein
MSYNLPPLPSSSPDTADEFWKVFTGISTEIRDKFSALSKDKNTTEKEKQEILKRFKLFLDQLQQCSSVSNP